MKRVSAAAIAMLKEALAALYWKKNDLRSFVELTIENKAIVSTIDWQENVKFESASQLVDRMAKRHDLYQDDLLLLIQAVTDFEDFSHLEYWEEKTGQTLIERAEVSVSKLREQSKAYFENEHDQKAREERRLRVHESMQESAAFRQKLEQLKFQLYKLSTEENAQKRGYDFEKLLNELFHLFDLNPRGSFKLIGEQIDGAFTYDSQDYLLEAKWQKELVGAQELSGFAGKIGGKFKNTVGLFLSFNGFSPESTKTKNPTLSSMILMDGQDLIQVLEGRIKLGDLLFLKRRHASETGNILYRCL